MRGPEPDGTRGAAAEPERGGARARRARGARTARRRPRPLARRTAPRSAPPSNALLVARSRREAPAPERAAAGCHARPFAASPIRVTPLAGAVPGEPLGDPTRAVGTVRRDEHRPHRADERARLDEQVEQRAVGRVAIAGLRLGYGGRVVTEHAGRGVQAREIPRARP